MLRLSKGSCCFAGTDRTTIYEITNIKNCSTATVAKIRYIPDEMYIHKYNMFWRTQESGSQPAFYERSTPPSY